VKKIIGDYIKGRKEYVVSIFLELKDGLKNLDVVYNRGGSNKVYFNYP